MSKRRTTSASPVLLDTGALAKALDRFAQERNWQQFHSPKNLVMALTGEVGELSELFQWLTEDQSRAVAHDPTTATAAREEIADVMLYLVRLASVLDIDLDEAVRHKLEINARKYPVEKASGSAAKYDQL